MLLLRMMYIVLLMARWGTGKWFIRYEFSAHAFVGFAPVFKV